MFFFLFRISDYMDLTPVDIVGKRCYHFIHAEDVEGIRHSHLDCKYFHFCQNNLVQQLIAPKLLFMFHNWDLHLAPAFFFVRGFHRGWLKCNSSCDLFSSLFLDI